MTKTQQISLLILTAMQANGGDFIKAYDTIMGEGAYMRLASEVYNTLRRDPA